MKTKYIYYFCIIFFISCSTNEFSEHSVHKVASNKEPIGQFNPESHITILSDNDKDSLPNRQFGDYNTYYRLSETAIRYKILDQILCLDPNIVDKLTGASVSSFYAGELFPYVEYLANNYGTPEEQLFMTNNFFYVVDPIYMIFNFPNDSGYVVYCTDSRVDDGLLMYSETGHIRASELSFAPLEDHIGFDMDGIDTNNPLAVYYFMDSIKSALFHMCYPDDKYNEFSSYTEYRSAMETLRCCTNNYYPSDPPSCIATTCETSAHSFRDRALHWHQSYPYNIYSYQGNLIGSVPLTIAKILTYSNYQDYLYNNYFDSYSYSQGLNMNNLYIHLQNLSNNLSIIQGTQNTICNQSAAIQLLRSLGYTIDEQYFDSFDELEYIEQSIFLGRYVVKILGNDWELVDAITYPRPCGSPFVFSDKSKFTFSLTANSVYDVENGFNTNAYPEYYDMTKYLVIYH